MLFKGEEIYNILPHRYPLMILDDLEIGVKYEEDKRITYAISTLQLNRDLWFFESHFPNKPMMPLSLMIECMTQTFCATFLSEVKKKIEIPVLSSISNVHQNKSACPGDRLKFEAFLVSFRRGVAKGICKAFLNNGNKAILELEIVEIIPSLMVKIV